MKYNQMGEAMESIITESDVEQKFIQPLLVNSKPFGLGYSLMDFKTKENIRKFQIDKGGSKKIYFPDYVIILNGFPIAIIEAKRPGEDVDEGFREARLYACELNATYPRKINPCQIIVCTNYNVTIAGYWDNEIPVTRFSNNDISNSQKNYYDFIELLEKANGLKLSRELLNITCGRSRLIKPVFLFGGRSFQSDLIGDNSFGTNLALDCQYIFNPESEEERRNVVLNAYIKSRKRESHISPIEKIIKRAGCIDSEDIITIDDTGNPKEIVAAFEDIERYKKAVCILIGSVGSGKSTFVDYLRFNALSYNVQSKSTWISLNMNNAPETADLIYSWVYTEMIESIKKILINDDISSLETLQKIFKSEIKEFENGAAKLLSEERQKEELYQLLKKMQNDNVKYLGSIIKYYFSGKHIVPIVVFDNCDKRSRDLQLLMFTVASWLKNNFDCMVFLPLRDTTFDQYKKIPPLDTAIKDLTFRIDPPLLDKVLQARYEYVLRELSKDGKDFCYTLSNGIRVNCKKDDLGNYSKSILRSIFQNDLSKRVFLGLTGRDIRKGLEIFLDFCKSGYITEDAILKIRNADGMHVIPANASMQIPIKGTRKYYNDSFSRIRNIFNMHKEDTFPDPYIRISILEWLNRHYGQSGPKNIKSYHLPNNIIMDLKLLGHNEDGIKQEIEEMIISDLIISESQQKKYPEDGELVSITSSGFIHLELIQNIYYLAFISEDTFFENEHVAQRIADNLLSKDSYPYISHQSILDNARLLVDYLYEYQLSSNLLYDKYLDVSSVYKYCDMEIIKNWVHKKIKDDSSFVDYDELLIKYPIGYIGDARVVKKVPFGYFLNFGINGIGLLRNTIEEFEVGDMLKVKILSFSNEHHKFNVELQPDEE